ncbi:winged helix-turn-helix domain-containing protein [Pseudoalteromonas luteoviolacea]|uniref:winged helix-turn-helix domain-containing protein n=1 Tax=Pseudoalteromonas luteoviolacea TaxID=43657 RepID=UPI001EEDDDAA|nr:winged helix-turn-helix domain-containing protein [Pseudoalteromonas luteoviolacea]MCF6441595.1 winged helix-turn-helix domain-containing protein [Pseudoalteromonas luteoviolacea]
MQKDSIRASLGEFVIDLGQSLLFLKGEEVSVEPKVMELLLYLYDCRGRYVTVEELHDHVWADRVVTDTAVRGTVKKLRVILSDDDLNNPKYIKSVAKRGYKLVCETKVLFDEDEHPPTSSIESSNSNLKSNSRSQENIKPQKRSFLAALLSLFFILLTVSFMASEYIYNDTHLIGKEHLTEFKGEKKSLAISSDGRFIAFTGRYSEDGLSQVYLLDKQEGVTRQLTTRASNARFISFAQNDKVLVFTDTVTGASALKLLPLTVSDPESAMVTLLENKFLISGVASGRVPSEILVQLAEDAEAALVLYAMDLESLNLTRLVTPTHRGEYIVGGAVSPDKSRLMTIVVQSGKYQLVIHDFTTQLDSVLSEQNRRIDGAVWLNDEEALFLDTEGLHVINVNTAESKQVYENLSGLVREIAASQTGHVVAIEKSQERANRLYIERALSGSGDVSRVINTAPEITSMLFDPQDEQMRWVRVKKNNINYVGHFNIKNDDISMHYQTTGLLEILDVAQDNQHILVKENHRLAILDIHTGTLLYLTADSSVSSDAVFYQDSKYVLFGMQVAGEWEIQKYDLNKATTDVFLRNFRSIRPANTGFIAANSAGDLYHLASLQSIAEPLGHQISYEFISRWHVKQNTVIWTDFDYLKSYVHFIDIETKEHVVIEDLFYSMYPRISVDKVGEHVVYLSVQINDSAIQQLFFD